MKQTYEMFAAYNAWANMKIYDEAALLDDEQRGRNLGAFFGSVTATLNHMITADRIWMKRFTGRGEAPSSLDAIVDTRLPALRAIREEEDRRIIDWISGLTGETLAGRFSYMTVTDMRTVSQRLAPALAHFFNHQTHHRGQLHMMLTVLGRESLTLDLIYFQRTEEGRRFA